MVYIANSIIVQWEELLQSCREKYPKANIKYLGRLVWYLGLHYCHVVQYLFKGMLSGGKQWIQTLSSLELETTILCVPSFMLIYFVIHLWTNKRPSLYLYKSQIFNQLYGL